AAARDCPAPPPPVKQEPPGAVGGGRARPAAVAGGPPPPRCVGGATRRPPGRGGPSGATRWSTAPSPSTVPRPTGGAGQRRRAAPRAKGGAPARAARRWGRPGCLARGQRPPPVGCVG